MQRNPFGMGLPESPLLSLTAKLAGASRIDARMQRKTFLSGVGAISATWPLFTRAQAPRKPVIGVLFHSNAELVLGNLRKALQNLGYREGDKYQLELRVANGSAARLAEMASELAARKVDVIFAFTTPAALAAKAATTTIPIIISAADPVGSGLVASLARPGGNVTGMSLAVAEMAGKILELLREGIPGASRIGALVNPTDPFHVRLIEAMEATNKSVRGELRVFKVAGLDDIAANFRSMATQRVGAVIIQPTLPQAEVIAQAIKYRMPTASPVRNYSEAGGLLSYSGKSAEVMGIVATQVDQILKGAKPADIPVRQPTQFELVINMKTAKAIGLTVPPLLLARADELIE